MFTNTCKHIFKKNVQASYNLRHSAVVKNIKVNFSIHICCWCTWTMARLTV